MPTPFPGMDPYLERPAMWPGVHNALITLLQLSLSPLVRPRYYLSLEERVYIAELSPREAFLGRPDVVVIGLRGDGPAQETASPQGPVLTVQVPVAEEVRETYLEVRETETNYVITVLELLSPTNKRPGLGRQIYERKRLEVLATRTHLVEIDLLRAGEPMPVLGDGQASDYRILVSRGNRRPNASLYTFGVQQPVPTFPLPLQKGDQEPVVDLGQLLHELYDRAGYDLRLDYKAEPEPPLRESDARWADGLLRQQGLR